MADRKNEKQSREQDLPAGKQMSESSPNPHGESKVLKMPITTDQRNATGGRNVPQLPNTVGGKLNPSVAHEFRNRMLSNQAQSKNKDPRAPRRENRVTVIGGRKKDS
jgi:hypothetical protein